MTRREQMLAMAADVEAKHPHHAATLRFWASQLREKDDLRRSQVLRIKAEIDGLFLNGRTRKEAARVIADKWAPLGFSEATMLNIARGNHRMFRES